MAAVRRRLAAVLGIVLCSGAMLGITPLAAAAQPGPATLEHINLAASDHSATLTLRLSAASTAHVFRLHAPERLVIDLPNAHRRARLPAAPAGSIVISLRAGAHGRHGLRLVLELHPQPALRLSRHVGAAGRELRLELAPVAAVARVRAHARLRTSPKALPLRGIRAAHAPSGQRVVIVAVDPGHGGVDPGATGPDGTHEKDVTLAIARALAALIDRRPGMRAMLTRDGDYFVALRDRMARAHAAHADLFVSIHADSVRDHAVSGASVYILSERGASSEAARRLADEENAADLKGGISLADQAPDLRSVLLDLSQTASIGESGAAAVDVLDALDGVGAVRRSEVQHAAFVVLKSPDLPSMLVETAYISNPADERRLRNPKQQRRLAGAIFSGIAAYFRQYPPQGSLFARTRGVATPDPSS
ncbi:MAG: N-acetylmuramoyl-L-alanine amidase [Steroidobacteraceae bacterium]